MPRSNSCESERSIGYFDFTKYLKFMNKIVLFALVCAGLAANLPAVAKNVPQSVDRTVNSKSTDLIAQYRRNDRLFSVYYRYRGDRQWNFENSYVNRRNAEAAARRLERRGYRTYIQLSRRVNRF
jgi:hypothetical protein